MSKAFLLLLVPSMSVEVLLKYLSPRTCLNCGSLCTFDGLLCYPCQTTLFKKWEEGLHVTEHEVGLIWTLCEWTPGESDVLSRLVFALKGRNQRRAWNFYAQIFAKERLLEPIEYREIILVSPPESAKSRCHGRYWAESLANHLGAKVIAPFRVISEKQQKHGNLEERATRRYELREEFTSFVQENTDALWVFADDIVTTGSSAKAAYLALESPPHFEVWALVQRGALLRSVLGSVINAE